jgi:secondary thiamine-phosphate synthase enzyme
MRASPNQRQWRLDLQFGPSLAAVSTASGFDTAVEEQRADAVDSRAVISLGDISVIVLSATSNGVSPRSAAIVHGDHLHDAAQSSRGELQVATGYYVHREQPEAVIHAIDSFLPAQSVNERLVYLSGERCARYHRRSRLRGRGRWAQATHAFFGRGPDHLPGLLAQVERFLGSYALPELRQTPGVCCGVMGQLRVQSQRHREFLDITRQVQEVVRNSGVADGICIVFSPHTTAGITLNENADPAVVSDLLQLFDEWLGDEQRFQHAEGNSGGHALTSLVGPSVTVPVADGALALGRWQAVYLCEFDGPRQRTVQVQVLAHG